MPAGLRALVNIVPLVVVLVVVGLVGLGPVAEVGFPLAGFVGAAGCVTMLSAFSWVVRTRS